MYRFSNIILASKSPRRQEILTQHGIEPVIRPAETDETIPEGTDVRDAVMYLALKKALACRDEIMAESGHEDDADSLIIAADTVVFKDEILGKPSDRDDAERMIRLLSGDSHDVATGVALVPLRLPEKRVFCETTRVFVKELTDKQINDYLETGEPYDKAGAYAIQGIFGRYIDRIEGDYENVIGLPYIRLRSEMRRLSHDIETED